MATVKEINHDSSTNINVHYDTVNDADGALTCNAISALDGTTNGVEIDQDAGINNATLTEAFTALTGNDLRWRIRVKLSSLTHSNGIDASFAEFQLQSNASDNIFSFLLSSAGGGNFQVEGIATDDGSTGTSIGGTPTLISSNQEVCLEIRAIEETADGNNDGIAEFFVDGVSQGSLSDIDNFNLWQAGIDTTFILFTLDDADFTGSFYYDEWILDDDSTTSLCALATTLSLADMTKPADIDAADEFIYVALLEGGTPILTKISTALDSDGTTVFNPGAGTNIGVECGRFNSDVVWIAGAFDGTNVVEKSEDGGSSFTAKDDGTFTEIFTFVVGPDTDDRVLVNNNDTDIIETIDSGETWTKTNDGGSDEINTMARLGKNVQECAFGNIAGVTNSISYSVNSGADLEDYQTGVYPNASATKVIAN